MSHDLILNTVSEFSKGPFHCNIHTKFWENKKCSKPIRKKSLFDGECVQVHEHAYVHNHTHSHIFLTELISMCCMTEGNAGGRSTTDIWNLNLRCSIPKCLWNKRWEKFCQTQQWYHCCVWRNFSHLLDIWKLAFIVFYYIWVSLNSAENKHDIRVHVQPLQVSYLPSHLYW